METDSVLHLETKQDSSVVLSLVRVHCSSFSSIKPPFGRTCLFHDGTTSGGGRERGTRGRVGPTRENLVVGERGETPGFPVPGDPLEPSETLHRRTFPSSLSSFLPPPIATFLSNGEVCELSPFMHFVHRLGING